MLLRVLCIHSDNPAGRGVADAVRRLNLIDVEVVETNAAQFHPLDAVVGCDRLVIVDDAAAATVHQKLVADAFEAATDMNLGVPSELAVFGAESVLAVPRIVSRIRSFAKVENKNRRDSSMCHTDICDVCIGESSCADKFVLKPEPSR